MKRSIKSLILRKAAVVITAACAASLVSVAVSHDATPASGSTVSVRAGGPSNPEEWNSQG
ncbi:hypothetical protein [Streptomyces sp. NBC_00083]|uniref:hypothetical protein n=1 Tax=Streptomyces sp. NBC_00083 TaxID=2975647 RepID=UPI002256981D|nr:hypothetical protein [Streptomyces sp. NBC_00083]MCX5387060.1 hypothetical protein [Streptomyces sp. NBC_00083]